MKVIDVRSLRTLACSAALLCASTALAQNGGPPPAAVIVAEVTLTNIAPAVSIPGTVLSRLDSRISTEVEGRVIWFEDVGTSVAAGNPVVRLESTTLEIQREEFLGQVTREEARLLFLEPEVVRLETLAAQDIAAKSLLNQVQSDLEVARGDLLIARARLKQVEDQIAKMTIPAPFNGVVSERLVNLGEMINRLDVVARLVSPETIEIISRAPLNAVAFLEVDSELRIYNDYRQGTGKVRAIVPFGDPQSHMFELRVDVPAASWIVGESVRLDVPSAKPKLAVAAPRDALVLRREGTFVFRVGDDNVAQRVLVSTGVADGDLIEVTGSIEPGDRVVVRGAERLADGQSVAMTERTQEGG